MNPGDYHVARESCGMPFANHRGGRAQLDVNGAMRSKAAYNNGILPFKRYIVGEAYTRDGQPAMLKDR